VFLNPAWWLTRPKARVTGFERVTRVNLFFYKSKRRHFGKKKKINGLQPDF
jgi:hypothetical protein